MFKNSVSSTMLTSDAANTFFPNITGESYGSDCTFLATLRALVAPRLPEGESIHLSFGSSEFNAAVVSETPAKRMVDMICGNMYFGGGQVYIHNLRNRDEDSNVACIELLKSQFCEVYDGWQFLDKISLFYQKSFRVICFINPNSKSVALFVDNLNLQKIHYLQAATLALFPWYFDPAKGVSEIELALVQSFRERNSDKYLSCIAEIAKQYDFESGRIRHMLADFETAYERRECEKVKGDISRIDSELNNLDSRIAEFLRKRNDLCIRLLGLERRIEDGVESEIMEYFLCNRKLYLEMVDRNYMYFAVRDYLSYFDEDAAQSYINRESGYFYQHCGSSFTKEGMKKLLNAIFVEQTLKIRFCAAYRFELTGSVRPESNHEFGPEFDGYKPNPHIQRYACMGNYTNPINKALQKRDYITALEQCIASAKSLNFHDSTVMEYFVGEFTRNGGSAYKAIELPDGRIVSPKEAIKWIEEQEAAANAAAEPETETVPVADAADAERVTTVVEETAPAETEGEPVPF